MEKIIWNELWSSKNKETRNFSFFLNSILKSIWIKRLKNEVLLKNHRFIEMLSLLNEEITYVSTDLDWSWYKIKNMFLIEDEDYINYLKLNISKIKSWDLLIWFLYNWITIKSVVFWEQIKDDWVINDNIIKISERVNSSLSCDFDI